MIRRFFDKHIDRFHEKHADLLSDMRRLFNKYTKRDIRWLQEVLEDDIAAKTGFKAKNIKLQISKRSNKDIAILDHHEFMYEGKNYVLIGTKLECIE